MSGASYDYKFGQKNNWRRWQWNRIVERLTVEPRDAVVLYLAGQNDYDRIEARRRGFRAENMIAVEKDKKAYREIKRRKILAMNCDLMDLLNAWTPNRKVDVVIADLCGGLNYKLLTLTGLMVTYPHLKDCVFSFNVLRGRDQQTNDWRLDFSCLPIKHDKKHRAVMLFYYYFQCALIFSCGMANLTEDGLLENNGRQAEHGLMKTTSGRLIADSRPAYNSYLSKKNKFDSIVWASPMGWVFSKYPELFGKVMWAYKNMQGVSNVRMSIAATMAHRTMRKERIGIYA